MSKLTLEQEQRVCEIIDTWYLIWKEKITDEGVSHKLGWAKSQLVDALCEPENFNISIDRVFFKPHIGDVATLMRQYEEARDLAREILNEKN